MRYFSSVNSLFAREFAKRPFRLRVASGLLLCVALASSLPGGATPQLANAQVQSHDMHRHSAGAPANSQDDKTPGPLVPPDSAVLNQDGKKIHFYSDLVKNKVVVINFIYTSCQTVCPAQAANFSRLQSRLGDRLGKEVFLISVSVDPEIDTPQRLRAWGARFGAQKGWTMVTGPKLEIDNLVRALTGDPTRKDNHGLALLIYDDHKREWIREAGLANAEGIIQRIDHMGK